MTGTDRERKATGSLQRESLEESTGTTKLSKRRLPKLSLLDTRFETNPSTFLTFVFPGQTPKAPWIAPGTVLRKRVNCALRFSGMVTFVTLVLSNQSVKSSATKREEVDQKTGSRSHESSIVKEEKLGHEVDQDSTPGLLLSTACSTVVHVLMSWSLLLLRSSNTRD